MLRKSTEKDANIIEHLVLVLTTDSHFLQSLNYIHAEKQIIGELLDMTAEIWEGSLCSTKYQQNIEDLGSATGRLFF